MDDQETEKGFKCSTCELTFHLKWALNKHEKTHKEISVKQCFFHQEPYPILANGCKFLNVQSEVCSLDDCQDLLGPFTKCEK